MGRRSRKMAARIATFREEHVDFVTYSPTLLWHSTCLGSVIRVLALSGEQERMGPLGTLFISWRVRAFTPSQGRG